MRHSTFAFGLLVALSAGRPLPAAENETYAGYRTTTLEYKAPDGSERKRSVTLWYPTAAKAERHSYRPQVGFVAADADVLGRKNPLILFSHGFLGAADQTIFLTEELARQGYIVAGVNHADSLRERSDGPQPRPNFAQPQTWDDTKYRDRRDDVVALLDHLLALSGEKDSFLFQRVNPQQVGALGHSLGGYTVLGLAGGWKAWHEPRIKATVALSPYSLPYVKSGKDNVKAINIPIMFQGGTLDIGVTPFLPPLYDQLAAPKYLLTLKNENHFGWTNFASFTKTTTDTVQQGNPQLITDYTVAFFDHHLRRLPAAELLTKENERLEAFKYAAK
ncbi:MAG TPA: alpha/beta fold hydrolase [Pirellulaceae bacterium]|nr:alpha/beta fold hydrolase [Pirellulaceae bacterium]